MSQDLDFICGGQGRSYKSRWRIFISAFDSAGIELVFVKDGIREESKRKKWIERQYQDMDERIFPIFDALVIK
jgi:hypothetical protein